jgi:hypothetical protein
MILVKDLNPILIFNTFETMISVDWSGGGEYGIIRAVYPVSRIGA